MTEKLLRAIAEIFPSDNTRPGLVLSYLERENQWYASVARYPGRDQKIIVCQAREDTLDKALTELSKNLLTAIGRGTHVSALEKAVADSTAG